MFRLPTTSCGTSTYGGILGRAVDSLTWFFCLRTGDLELIEYHSKESMPVKITQCHLTACPCPRSSPNNATFRPVFINIP
jgi:hypothetical protein